MPPRGVESPRRQRQYEHIKDSEEKRGVGAGRAKEIAARTVNKQRRESGQTMAQSSGGRKKSSGGRKKSTGRRKKSTGDRKKSTGGRKKS